MRAGAYRTEAFAAARYIRCLFVLSDSLSLFFIGVEYPAPVGELVCGIVLRRDRHIDIFAVAPKCQRKGFGGKAVLHIRVEKFIFARISDGASCETGDGVTCRDACLLTRGNGEDFGYGEYVTVFVAEDEAVEIVAVEFHAELR